MKEWIITTTYLDKVNKKYGAFAKEYPIDKLDDFLDQLFQNYYPVLSYTVTYEDEDMDASDLEEEHFLEYISNWTITISEGNTDNLEIVYDERK